MEKFLLGLENKGYKNILLYGAGEVAETILGILKNRIDKSLKVIALVDDNEQKQNNTLLGYDIIPREEIKNHKHDGIVITSYTFEEDIRKRLEEIDYLKDKVERFFTV